MSMLIAHIATAANAQARDARSRHSRNVAHPSNSANGTPAMRATTIGSAAGWKTSPAAITTIHRKFEYPSTRTPWP